MSGESLVLDRAGRRAATRDGIVAAAWDLARERGLTGWAMRDLGDRVGMKAQSLYSYFSSKHDIYDAMFAGGYERFAEHMGIGDDEHSTDPRVAARLDAHRFFEFCVDDPVRFQMLFMRTVPGFEPSPASFGAAVRLLDEMTRRLVATGADAGAIDLWTAVLTGLASQQIANDPGGDRWRRLVDDAVDMLLAHTTPTTRKGRTR